MADDYYKCYICEVIRKDMKKKWILIKNLNGTHNYDVSYPVCYDCYSNEGNFVNFKIGVTKDG